MEKLIVQSGLGGPFGNHWQVYSSPDLVDREVENIERAVRDNQSLRHRLERAINALRGESVPEYVLNIGRCDAVNKYSNRVLSALDIELVPLTSEH